MSKRKIDRRDFITRVGMGGLALGLGATACGAVEDTTDRGEPAGALETTIQGDPGPKTGLCTIAFEDRPFGEVLRLAADAGFDGVEPWGKPDHLPPETPDDRIGEAVEMIGSLGLEVSHYGSYTRLGDGQPAAEKDAEMDRVVEVTRMLGANICRIWAGTKDSELLTEEDWAMMVDDGRRFCARAEDAGILLAIEMHSNSVTNKAAAAVELIERVGSPALKLNYQILNESEDPYERARVAGPHVVMVHAQNAPAQGRGRPLICDGAVDFQRIWDILAGDFGFEGYFEVEFVLGETLEQKVAALRKDQQCLRSIG